MSESFIVKPSTMVDRRVSITAVSGSFKAGGTIFVPAREIEARPSYTFEYEEFGKLYRWTDQTPSAIEGEFARFRLPEIDPVAE
jgi:hypothetical protein